MMDPFIVITFIFLGVILGVFVEHKNPFKNNFNRDVIYDSEEIPVWPKPIDFHNRPSPKTMIGVEYLTVYYDTNCVVPIYASYYEDIGGSLIFYQELLGNLEIVVTKSCELSKEGLIKVAKTITTK